jgi:hypothetical protein
MQKLNDWECEKEKVYVTFFDESWDKWIWEFVIEIKKGFITKEKNIKNQFKKIIEETLSDKGDNTLVKVLQCSFISNDSTYIDWNDTFN